MPVHRCTRALPPVSLFFLQRPEFALGVLLSDYLVTTQRSGIGGFCSSRYSRYPVIFAYLTHDAILISSHSVHCYPFLGSAPRCCPTMLSSRFPFDTTRYDRMDRSCLRCIVLSFSRSCVRYLPAPLVRILYSYSIATFLVLLSLPSPRLQRSVYLLSFLVILHNSQYMLYGRLGLSLPSLGCPRQPDLCPT